MHEGFEHELKRLLEENVYLADCCKENIFQHGREKGVEHLTSFLRILTKIPALGV